MMVQDLFASLYLTHTHTFSGLFTTGAGGLSYLFFAIYIHDRKLLFPMLLTSSSQQTRRYTANCVQSIQTIQSFFKCPYNVIGVCRSFCSCCVLLAFSVRFFLFSLSGIRAQAIHHLNYKLHPVVQREVRV